MRAALAVSILFFSLLLTGCWNRTELNVLGITSATGIDGTKGKWLLTYQTIVPSSMTSGTGGASGGVSSASAIHVFSTAGKTLREAVVQSDLEYSRKLYFAHNNVLIIGKQAAETGISEIMDLYFRNPDLRETVQILVADGTANEMLKQFVPPERLGGSAIAGILRRESRYASFLPVTNMFDLALGIHSDSGAAGVPVIGISGRESEKTETADVFKESSVPAKLRLMRMAVFKGDKLAGSLSMEESRGIAWLRGKVRSTTLSFPCSAADRQNPKSSFRINSSDTRIKLAKAGDHYKIRAKVKVKGRLMETGCMEDISSPSVIAGFERQIEKEIAGQIRAGWEGAKAMKADLPGFADKIHRKYPEDWKALQNSWDEELKRLELEVKVEARIAATGLTKKSFKGMQGDGKWHE